MKRFALADCNNFFVSCEQVFDPALRNKPVVVLSSNDACVIARSYEAKKIGIKMGQPAHECTDIFRIHNVQVFSANFALYGDMSARIMQTLSDYSTDFEVYSIDEAFLHLPPFSVRFKSESHEGIYYTQYAQWLRKIVQQQVGVPISIGLGPTKTLAKVANHLAKTYPEHAGVFDITNHPAGNEILALLDVKEVWGIGSRYARLLKRHGIYNAYQFTQCSDAWVRKNMSINGLKTVLELRGIECFKMHDMPDAKKSITVSRSFGTNVTDLDELKQALAYHVSTAAEKLRRQKMITGFMSVFVCSTSYTDSQRSYNSAIIQLPLATSFTPALIAAGAACVQQLYKKGLIYKKIGVMLSDFYDAGSVQLSTLDAMPDLVKQAALMKTIDTANAKMGKNKLFFAALGTQQKWHAKRSKKSPAYTTNWHELLTIKI